LDNDCDGNTDIADSDCDELLYRSVATNDDCYCTIDLTGKIKCICSSHHSVYDLSQTSSTPSYQPIPTNAFEEISIASEVACGIDSAYGAIKCWGNTDHLIFQNAPTADEFQTVTVGEKHACAVDRDDGVTCWGDCISSTHCGNEAPNDTELCDTASYGDGYCARFNSSAWPPGSLVTDLAVADDVTCVVHNDPHTSTSTVTCAGSAAQYSPNGPDGSLYSSLDFVSDGRNDGCGLVSDTSPHSSLAQCWPPAQFNLSGQRSFIQDPDGNGFTNDAIDCGPTGCCAITATQEMTCWDISGVLPLIQGPFRSVAAGDGFACGVLSDGTLDCRGSTPTP